MADYKEPPTTEKSLNQISWHLKTLVEEFKGLNQLIKEMTGSRAKFKPEQEIGF